MDLVTFTEEILNEKLNFLCSENSLVCPGNNVKHEKKLIRSCTYRSLTVESFITVVTMSCRGLKFSRSYISHIRFRIFIAFTIWYKLFTKVFQTEYSAFKSLTKMSHKQVTSAVIVALISEKNSSKKKKYKRKVDVKPWLKRSKNLGSYETLRDELTVRRRI